MSKSEPLKSPLLSTQNSLQTTFGVFPAGKKNGPSGKFRYCSAQRVHYEKASTALDTLL